MKALGNEPSPLPAGVGTLLEAHRRARPRTPVRLWWGRGEPDRCVYPPSTEEETPCPGVRLTVPVPDGQAVALEVSADAARHPATHLLVAALTQAFTAEYEARSTARELTERYEEINLLYFISETLGSMLSLPEAATRILAEVADVLGAQRASLWVYQRDDGQLHLTAAVGEDGLRGPIAPDDPESATAWVFREKQVLNLERGSRRDEAPRLEPRPRGREAFLSVPINYTPPDGGPRTVGVITLVGRRSDVRFTAGDVRLLSAVASQVGAALETQRLVQESLRQERVVRELELAHDLQLKLLPDPSTYDPPPEVAARCVPAESVGGDFYHLIRLPAGRLGAVIGDVSSHGFSAALIMALTLSAVSIYASESQSPAEVLRRVHRALAKELESTEMYLTLFYAVIDPGAQHLTFASAGHPYAFLVSADGACRRLGALDPPMGIATEDQYGECTVPWEPRCDLLCLFTDGLSDAFARGRAAGEAALLAELVRNREQPLDRLLDRLFRAAPRTRRGVPPDDRTALLIRG